MDTGTTQLLKTLKHYLFNKISLVISISVIDLLINVFFSEVCSKNYTVDFGESPWKNLSLYYKYNITCYTKFNNESYPIYDNMQWEDVLSRKSLTCLRYWKYRSCSSSTNSTSNCFSISKKPNFNLNESYLGTSSESQSKTENTIMLIYLLQTVTVCLEDFQITIKKVRVCSIQSFKDHMFRVFPIITHSASVVELLRSPELQFAYGNSVLFYVSCLLAKSVFNVIVVSRSFKDNSYICMVIGIALHLSWLIAQAWQIVISYQIWKCFRSESANVRQLVRTRPKVGVSIKYYPLAWILPIIIVLFTLSMDHLPGVPDNFRPGLGVCKCWFIDERTRMVYAALPAAFADTVALVMFLATLYHFRAARAVSRTLLRSDSRRHCLRENRWIMIYMKVSFLTGASYVLVTLLALYTLNYKVPQGVPSYIINTVKDIERLRGTEIFYIFVLSKKHFLQAPTSSNNEQSARNLENIPLEDLRVASN